VGTGAIRRISDTDCELTRLYVQEEHRREGIASCIAAELFKFVQQRGYRRVFLEIRPEMEQATRVIARYGFGEVADAEDLPRPAKFMAIHFPDGA
jgi:ribosomal protein S18 acetylase RimI-like enzyme